MVSLCLHILYCFMQVIVFMLGILQLLYYLLILRGNIVVYFFNVNRVFLVLILELFHSSIILVYICTYIPVQIVYPLLECRCLDS